MEENKVPDIPYIAYESSQVRLERINRRLWILCIILIVVLLVTNAGWIYYENQWEDVVVTQEAVADGNSDVNLQNVGGDYYGGQSEADNQNKEKKDGR